MRILAGFVLHLSRLLIFVALRLLCQHDDPRSGKPGLSRGLRCLRNPDSAALQRLALYQGAWRVLGCRTLQRLLTQSDEHICICSALLREEVGEEATEKRSQ